MQRNHKTYFRSKLWFNTEKIIFLSTSALEMLFKENSLHPKVAVNPEKHLFLTWSCKPDKHYTSLSKLNIQRFAPFFCFERKFLQTRNNILAVLRLKIRLSNEMLFAQSFRQFSKKMTFKQVRNSSLLFNGFGEASIIFLPSSENDFQC